MAELYTLVLCSCADTSQGAYLDFKETTYVRGLPAVDACVQTIRDGKSIIIEGLHLDPGLYLHEFGKYGISHLHTRHDSMLPVQPDTGQQGDAVLVEPVNPEPLNPDRDVQRGAQLQPDDGHASFPSDMAKTHTQQERTSSYACTWYNPR